MKAPEKAHDLLESLILDGADPATAQRAIDEYCGSLDAIDWLASATYLLEDKDNPLADDLANALRAARDAVVSGAGLLGHLPEAVPAGTVIH